jgi:uncharacterized membrane protein YkvI
VYTVLLALINFALQSEYPQIKNEQIPTLKLANEIIYDIFYCMAQ